MLVNFSPEDPKEQSKIFMSTLNEFVTSAIDDNVTLPMATSPWVKGYGTRSPTLQASYCNFPKRSGVIATLYKAMIVLSQFS